jgi:hypothetical protein
MKHILLTIHRTNKMGSAHRIHRWHIRRSLYRCWNLAWWTRKEMERDAGEGGNKIGTGGVGDQVSGTSGRRDRSIFFFLRVVGGDRVRRHHGSSISHLLHPVVRDLVPIFSSISSLYSSAPSLGWVLVWPNREYGSPLERLAHSITLWSGNLVLCVRFWGI